MKRGFLQKAFNDGQRLIDKRSDQKLQPPSPKASCINLHDIVRGKDLSKFRLPYGNLTDQEKALPVDYDKNNPTRIPTSFKTIPHIPDGDGSTEWIIRDEHSERRVTSTPGYPARTPKPRRPDFCEVRTTPDMGLGVFAKHNIKRGDIIFSERPLLIAPSWLMSSNGRRYSDAQSYQIMMFEFEKVLEAGVQRMDEANKALYMALHNSHSDDGTGPLLGIMRTNGFSTDELSDGSPLHYSSVCNVGSRLNHSCKPNVHVSSFEISSFSLQFIAVRDIKAGEELYCSYCGISETKPERQTSLAPYGFSCACAACIKATPATDDLRKTFKDQASRLEARAKQPESRFDAVASAKVLEAEMVAEGLDRTLEFFTLLCVIQVASFKLGRMAETRKYEHRARDYCRIHVHERRSFLEFLCC